jgi:ubiquinone/menaquinone biosynthesis C-methylase UbiE
VTAAFDGIARDYNNLWDGSGTGRLQREAVWRFFEPLFRAGDTILDLGCGTGEDALRFARRGVKVVGIDESSEMVRIARERGVDACVCRIEDMGSLSMTFDGAVSDFGALNCVADLAGLREPLERLIAPGGYLAICVMGRFCLWETVRYLFRGDIRKAVRRWKGSAPSSLGMQVFYPTVKEIARAFSPGFALTHAAGIGGWPPLMAIADHRILIFRRV